MSEVKRPELWGGRMLSEDEKEQADTYMDHLEAERDRLRDNLKRIRDAVWETGVCAILSEREDTHE